MPIAAARRSARSSVHASALAAAVALLLTASPAAAQPWTQVLEVPAGDIYSVFTNGDTIAAGGDSVVHVSTDAGATWQTSADVADGVTSVQGVAVHNGRLYAATYGQGVFVSDDLGDTWASFNQGLTGGIFDTHLFTSDLLVHGNDLYLATSGAGVYKRNLAAGTWSHFGEVFEPNQASNTNGIAAGGSRLLVCSGFNGTVFFRDPGDPDWTLSWLNNIGILPGLGAMSAVWTGDAWVVGTNIGMFLSPVGEEPWQFVDPGFGTLFNSTFALLGPEVFGAFSQGFQTLIAHSHDDGATWPVLDTQPGIFVYELAMNGTTLYAGRADGLWRRSVADVSVPPRATARLHFAIAGPQPTRNVVRFRFELPEAGRATLEVFDVSGRRAAEPIEGSWSAGPHEIAWNARQLPPGVYAARFSALGQHETARIVRVP